MPSCNDFWKEAFWKYVVEEERQKVFSKLHLVCYKFFSMGEGVNKFKIYFSSICTVIDLLFILVFCF